VANQKNKINKNNSLTILADPSSLKLVGYESISVTAVSSAIHLVPEVLRGPGKGTMTKKLHFWPV